MNVEPIPHHPRLSARLLAAAPALSDAPSLMQRSALPERVLQFGEGNFLRAFVDWMIERMNRQGLFGGRVVAVQPIASGMADAINAQDGLYTVLLRGLENGRARETRELVSAVSRCINPYRDFDAFLDCADNPDLKFVVSNTTEAGIRVDAGDRLDARPAPSFPGKLVQLLYARFRRFDGDPARGLVMLPCELIERNGDTLRDACQETADRLELPSDFQRFLSEGCTFTNTLVDRIVTGYPRDEAAALAGSLGYEDALLVAGELFHAWIIESPRPLEQELPLRRSGLNVVFTHDVTPYRDRKVRILNGAHTMTVLAAFLAGKETMRECMDDPLFSAYVERGIHDEILPTLTLPRQELVDFAGAVSQRFKNPFVEHKLTSIALNSVSKYKARILGTVSDYRRARRELPPRLTFAMAALIAFYRGTELRDGALIGERNGAPYAIRDERAVLDFFHDAWSNAGARPDRERCTVLVEHVLARTDFWGADLNVTLPGFTTAVSRNLHAILEDGARMAIERLGVAD